MTLTMKTMITYAGCRLKSFFRNVSWKAANACVQGTSRMSQGGGVSVHEAFPGSGLCLLLGGFCAALSRGMLLGMMTTRTSSGNPRAGTLEWDTLEREPSGGNLRVGTLERKRSGGNPRMGTLEREPSGGNSRVGHA